MGCSTSLAKMILFIFNVAFFIFGIASLGLGIWVAVNKNDLFRFINLVDSQVTEGANQGDISSVANQSGAVTAAGYVLIGLGLFTLLVGFCGCCGAMKESKCLLMIYAGLVGLVLVLEITAAIMAAVFQSHVRNSAEAGMLRVQNRFFVAMPDYLRVQGTNVRMLRRPHHRDIANSSSWTASNRTFAGKELKVPLTCCRLRENRKNAVMDPRYNWTNFADDLQDSGCPYKPLGGNGGLNNATCYNSLLEYVSQYSKPIIIICVAIGLFEILGILFACCLIKAIENDVSYAKQ
uniref:Tetraspanin n=1 Tax=Macrostomum lignano TaxID=282301 RepID=A0A1I8I3I2_9PLAT